MNVRKMFRRCKKKFWRSSCIEDRWLLFFLYQFSFSKIKANYNFLITYSPYIFDEFYPFSFRPSIYWSLILQVFLQKILYTVFIRGSCRRHTSFCSNQKGNNRLLQSQMNMGMRSNKPSELYWDIPEASGLALLWRRTAFFFWCFAYAETDAQKLS